MFVVAIICLLAGIAALNFSIGIVATIALIVFVMYEIFGMTIKRFIWLKKYFNINDVGREISYTFTDTIFKAES